MQIQASDIKIFIQRRCNERIRATIFTNKNIEKFEKAQVLKFQLQNIFSTRLLCKFLLDNLADVTAVIIAVPDADKNGHTAYMNKLKRLKELEAFARNYTSNGIAMKSIDVVIMKNSGNFKGGN